MRKLWRLIFCVWGITLFAALTYHSIRVNQQLDPAGHRGRYFWWGARRLDSDPLNRRTLNTTTGQCPFNDDNCKDWEPDYIWITPGLIERALVLSAIPAFLVDLVIVRGLAHLGVSEVLTFMVTMPICIMLWFYSVGYLIGGGANARHVLQRHSC